MPNVADELAELRKKGAAKKHASSLESKAGAGGGAAGLSTPEAEEAALKAKKERERVGNYSKDAEANLARGVKDVGLENEFKLSMAEKKREDRVKKEEASKNLHGFKGEGVKEGAAAPDAKAAVPAAATTTAPVPDIEDDDDDDVPELEEAVPEIEGAAAGGGIEAGDAAAAAAANGGDEAIGKPVQNRSEKKARKMMSRLGMRPVSGIARVTLKTAGGRNGYFAIERPDVFVSSSGSNPTYVIFGEARQGGGGGMAAQAQAQAQAAQQQQERMRQARAATMAAAPQAQEAGPSIEEDVPGVEGDEEAAAADADETGVEAKDIELVMSQSGCSRSRAVAALKENDGDLVNAIMSLTS